jgi:hypothetical protein
MKSELINSKAKAKEINFPVLAKKRQEEYVILFYEEGSGVVVVGGAVYNVGDHDTDWISVLDDSIWEILPPGAKVVLKNT